MKHNLKSIPTPSRSAAAIHQRAIVLAAALLAQVAPGFAAEDVTRLSPVQVEEERAHNPFINSPKFIAPLRDTPQTVVVIPNDVYLQQGASTLSDALRNTPGITFAAGEGGGASATAGDAFYMRGFDASNNILVDGVRDVGAYSRDVFNLEQVEVAKGAGGADVGRGAASGYITVETKVPTNSDFAASSLTYGLDDGASGDRRRATLDLNQVLPASPVAGTAVRLNVMWQDSDAVGRDTAQARSWAVAPSLSLGLGTPTRVSLAYQHGEQDNIPDYGLPGSQFPGFVATPAPAPVGRSTFYGFTSDHDRVTTTAASARLEHDVNADLRLSSRTRYSLNSRDAVVTTPGTSPTSYVAATGLLTRSRQGNRRDTSILSNQTNLGARLQMGRVRHDLSAGLEFSSENAYSPAFTAATLAPILLTGSDPTAASGGEPVRSGAYTDVTIDTAALYAFDTVTFNRWLQFNGGLRLERYDIDYLSVATTGVATRLPGDGDLLTWKGGLVYKPAPAGSAYFAQGRSQRPPGSDFTLSSAAGNQNNPDTDPQVTDTSELGLKWNFLENRLATSVALFRTVNNKTVYTDAVLGPIPAGRQTVEGLELNVSGRVTDRWLVFAGFAYLDSEINAGTAAQVGTGLPLIPRVSGNAWTTYRFDSGLTLGGGVQYSGPANRLQRSTAAPVEMPGYALVNALVSYDFTPRLGLRLNVSNALNRAFVQSYNNNGGRFMPGAPRAWLLTANYRF
jgi:catecholate siderophore receptor